MLYTVAEVAVLTDLSKVSIYKRLALKELQEHVSKKQGITYVSEVGLSLIKDSLKLNDDLKQVKESEGEKVTQSLNGDILKAKDDYINHLKAENQRLWEQLQEKDLQIANLQRITENGQVLLKGRQLALEEKKSFFKDLFRKK